MKKLLVLSGKGGTGKTTTSAAFIKFSGAKAIADCDVDAPNLHIVAGLKEEPETSDFMGSDKAYIDPEKCIGCGACMERCRFDSIRMVDGKCQILEYACEGCGVCEAVCPAEAIHLETDRAGHLYLYRGDRTLSTAKLKMGRGNSGKLVSDVKLALIHAAGDEELAIIDGSPGIGCPVISSVSGVDMVLIVAEPSMSGVSDLERILKTASILQTKVAVCVNKFDTNREKTEAIVNLCHEKDIPFVGKIPYDKKASEAINAGLSLADFDCPARDALYETYQNTMDILNK